MKLLTNIYSKYFNILTLLNIEYDDKICRIIIGMIGKYNIYSSGINEMFSLYKRLLRVDNNEYVNELFMKNFIDRVIITEVCKY